MIEQQIHDRKVTGSSPSRIGRQISSPGSASFTDSYFSNHSTPVLPLKHVKDAGHSAKSADGRLQLNPHLPFVCGFE